MNTRKHQRGAALVVSLIILVAMTMLGITSMKSTTTELTMSGNLRESAITFQAAEVGLSIAEQVLENGDEPGNTLAVDTLDPDYLEKETWTSAAVTTVDEELANIQAANNPKFIIKSLGEWNPDRDVSEVNPGFGGYGLTSTAQKVDYFRVTARGFGQTGQTSRTLQSFFSRAQN